MAQLKVTQVKSSIGRKKNQRETLRSLGLKRIHDSVDQEDRPGTASLGWGHGRVVGHSERTW